MYIETYQRSALLFSSLIDRGDERHAFVIFLALLFFFIIIFFFFVFFLGLFECLQVP